MNRLIAAAAIGLLAVTVSACGDKDAKPAEDTTNTAVVAPAADDAAKADDAAAPAEHPAAEQPAAEAPSH